MVHQLNPLVLMPLYFSLGSVTFKTVPTDSTGVAHILEHTTLCGSEKYPVRDPFFNMLKRSLNTYMNAYTGMVPKPFDTKRDANMTRFFN
jgi:hypothetical protein